MKKLNRNQLNCLAEELIIFLQKNDLFEMIAIYVNGKKISSDRPGDVPEAHCENTRYGLYYVTPDVDVRDIVEYCNPETLTMTFEGPLYHEINYGSGKMEDKLQALFRKYGLYFELGYAWSLAAYPI